MDWDFLHTLNGTSFKTWLAGWLWVGTFVVWGIVAVVATISGKTPPIEWLLTWLGGLCTFSGLSYAQFKTMRETDYGALDKKVALEAAKNTPPAP